MPTYIALLRGINVGGKHIVPMKELRELLQKNGFSAVRTYIQSGNVVCDHPAAEPREVGAQMGKLIETRFGFLPRVMVLTRQTLLTAMAENPFPEGEGDPKSIHLYFMDEKPAGADLDLLENLKADSEKFRLKEKVFYLYAPEGIGRSRLAEKVERALGVPATARNWRSVGRIAGLAESE